MTGRPAGRAPPTRPVGRTPWVRLPGMDAPASPDRPPTPGVPAPVVVAPDTLTPTAFAPFGAVIAAGVDAPGSLLDLGRGTPRFWVMPVRNRPAVVERITRHRHVTQCLASADGATWLLAVSAPDHDPTAPGAVHAFAVPAATAVLLHRGTWHAGPYPLAGSGSFFNLELTDTNDADHDTVVLPAPVHLVVEQAGAPAGATVPAPRRVLVVANRTVSSPQLLAAITRLSGAGATSFRVLVPLTNPGAGLHALASASDPMAGLAPLAAMDLPLTVDAATREAQERLGTLLTELAARGVVAEGEIGVADPLEAVAAVLAAHPVDELLISTLPAGLSKWLSRDLPSRLAKRFAVPVTHVEAVG